MNEVCIFTHSPWGGFFLEADRVLWSPAPESTRWSAAGSLGPALAEIIEAVEQGRGIALDSPLGLVALMLERQGYLARAGEPSRLWDGSSLPPSVKFCPQLPLREGREESALYLFVGAAARHCWVYRTGPRQVCLDCVVGRWLENLGGDAAALRHASRALGWQPESGPELWQEWLNSHEVKPGQFYHAPLSDQSSSGEAVSLPGCSCAQQALAPRLWSVSGLSLATSTWMWNDVPHWHVATVTTSLGRGTGSDEDAQIAFFKARGEALERYCAERCEAPGELLDRQPPELFRPSQLRQRDFPYRAQRGRWLACQPIEDPHGPSAWFPREQILLCSEEDACCPSLSHGLACGRTREEALESAFWELIERDALTILWSRLQANPLRELPVSPAAQQSCQQLQASLELWDVPALQGVCRLAILRNPQGRLACGSAAHSEPSLALQKALGEAIQNFIYLSRQAPAQPLPHLPSSFSEHAFYYWHRPEAFPAFGRPANLDMGEVGPGYFFDLTTADVAQLGFRVVRRVHPDLLSLPQNHAHWTLAARRWKQLRLAPPRQPHPFG